MKKYIIVLLHALAGWIFCAAIMGIGPRFTTMENTLIIHLLAGPSGFGILSAYYHRKFGYTRPIITSAVFTFIVIFLDFFLAAMIILESFEMFTSIIGTWAPFLMIFIASYVAGNITYKKMENNNAAQLVQKKQAILFDLFHTLVNVGSSGGLSTSEILGVSKEDWNRELMENTQGRLTGEMKDPLEIISKMARAINPLIAEETIELALSNRIQKFAHALLNVSNETIYALKRLKSSGKKIGLVSNAEASEIEAWDYSPLSPLFDTAIFSCHAGVIKPKKDIYELCMRDLGVAPAECAFVGDGGSQELEGAKRIGIATVIITGFIKDISKEKLDERKKYADYVIENISGLLL